MNETSRRGFLGALAAVPILGRLVCRRPRKLNDMKSWVKLEWRTIKLDPPVKVYAGQSAVAYLECGGAIKPGQFVTADALGRAVPAGPGDGVLAQVCNPVRFNDRGHVACDLFPFGHYRVRKS
jgi:hypothetical protein